MHISKSKRCFNVKSSTYYFHMKMKILADFQIGISVPLIFRWSKLDIPLILLKFYLIFIVFQKYLLEEIKKQVNIVCIGCLFYFQVNPPIFLILPVLQNDHHYHNMATEIAPPFNHFIRQRSGCSV